MKSLSLQWYSFEWPLDTNCINAASMEDTNRKPQYVMWPQLLQLHTGFVQTVCVGVGSMVDGCIYVCAFFFFIEPVTDSNMWTVQPQSPDCRGLQEQQTAQPNSTRQIRPEKPEQCYQWGKLFFFYPPSPQQCNSRQNIEWKICSKTIFFMNYKNLMFILQIQNSHSASFIYFKLLQVSAMVQASQSGSRCSERFKIKFFFFPQTKTFRCVSTPSLMSSTCKHLVYLEGWCTM